MKKTLCLLAFLCTLPTATTHAEVVASGEDFESSNSQAAILQQQPQTLHLRFNFSDMTDTGTNLSIAEIVPQKFASREVVRVDAPPPTCRIYKTKASFYGSGSRTASGQRFDRGADTMATQNLRLGSTVYVRMPGKGQWVKGVANDYGPFVGGRGADLSVGYANHINFPTGRGVAMIEIADCGGGHMPSYIASRHKRRKG